MKSIFNYLRYKTYYKLRKENFQVEYRSLKSGLGDLNFNLEFNEHYPYDRNKSVKQYYLNFIGGKKLLDAYLLYKATGCSIKFLPLHKIYQDYLIQNGINVSRFFCTLTFWLYMFLFWLYGLLYFFSTLVKSFIVKNTNGDTDFFFFDRISKNNLPQPFNNGKSYDIISWMIDYLKLKNVRVIHPIPNINNFEHKNLEIRYGKAPFLVNFNEANKRQLLFESYKKIANSFLSFDWSQCLLLKEDLDSIFYLHGSSKNHKLKGYIIPNHITIYRPLWTYAAENKKINIITYFYSTMNLPLSLNGKTEDYAFKHLMNWPTNLIMNNDLKKELDINSNDSIKNILVKPIYFNTSALEIEYEKSCIISIYDIDPYKKSFHFGISTSNDYNLDEFEVHQNFLNDIIKSSSSDKVKFVIKPKRAQRKDRELKAYKRLLSKLNSLENVNVVSPEVSTFYLIEKSDLVISFPFTTPSFIAKKLNIKSIYYDSTTTLNQTDPAANGVEIIQSPEILKEIINSINETKECSTS